MSAIGLLLIKYNCRAGAPDIKMISYRAPKEVLTVLTGGKSQYVQLLIGLFFGSFSALLAVLLVHSPKFKDTRHFFEQLIGQMNPSIINIVFFSFCAGVGEELLFRGGIQPLIGIWWTSVIFVLLHGYIHPSNLNLTVYGLFLVIICSGFGYLFKFFGLTSAVVAHFIYDVSMFAVLKYSFRTHKG